MGIFRHLRFTKFFVEFCTEKSVLIRCNYFSELKNKERGEYALKSQKIVKISSATQKDEINKVIESCEQYRTQLIHYCLKFFECEYEYAEDCVQDAYVALVENLNNGVEIKDYKAWLYTVVLNCKNKTIKDKLKRNEYSFTSNEEKDKVLNNTLMCEPDYLEEIVSDQVIAERAIHILSSLNTEEKELYVSYYLKGKKLKDIATDFGVSHPTMRKRHTALKRKIKRKIKEFEEN